MKVNVKTIKSRIGLRLRLIVVGRFGTFSKSEVRGTSLSMVKVAVRSISNKPGLFVIGFNVPYEH